MNPLRVESVGGFQMQDSGRVDLVVFTPNPIFGADLHGTAWFPLLANAAGTTGSIDWDFIDRAVQDALETLTSWLVSRALRCGGKPAGARHEHFLCLAIEFSIVWTAMIMTL